MKIYHVQGKAFLKKTQAYFVRGILQRIHFFTKGELNADFR